MAADFFAIKVNYICLLPEEEADGTRLAHVGLSEELEGIIGGTVLAAGEIALELADEGYPVPAMPPSKPWHTRSISVGERTEGDGHDSDRQAMEVLGLSRPERAFSRKQARMILSRNWGRIYTLTDGLLREGLLVGDKVQRFLHPERQGSQGREVFYDHSASRAGLFYGDVDWLEDQDSSGAAGCRDRAWGPLGVKVPRLSRRAPAFISIRT